MLFKENWGLELSGRVLVQALASIPNTTKKNEGKGIWSKMMCSYMAQLSLSIVYSSLITLPIMSDYKGRTVTHMCHLLTPGVVTLASTLQL